MWDQYKASTETKDYYIGLLFYHLDLRCYVVVEIKNVDFDPSLVGQLQFYVTAIDETIKKDIDNPTVALLLWKEKDKLSVEWALKPVSAPIGVASYEIKQYLPSEEELRRLLIGKWFELFLQNGAKIDVIFKKNGALLCFEGNLLYEKNPQQMILFKGWGFRIC